jgi:hypothetical protein
LAWGVRQGWKSTKSCGQAPLSFPSNSGCLSKSLSNVAAVPFGSFLSCSQFRIVSRPTPNSLAKSPWVNWVFFLIQTNVSS